jgi:CRISPR/Cas system-associated exonuclease Cas4 (RecB family)
MAQPAEITSLYEGKVELKFSPGNHVYRVNGKWIPGVTSITGFMDNGKCEGLKRWAVKMAMESLSTQLIPGKRYDEIELGEAFDIARNEPFKRTKKAADIGTVAHNYVEKHIKYQLGETKTKPKMPVNAMAQSAVNNYLKWEQGNIDEYIFSERKVMSLDHWVAGTADIVAIVNGKLAMVDLKTSNYLSVEHLIQTAAYQLCLEEEFEDRFDNRIILKLDKEDGEIHVYDLNALAGSQLKLTPWMKINFHTYEEDKETFLSLRRAFRNVRNG